MKFIIVYLLLSNYCYSDVKVKVSNVNGRNYEATFRNKKDANKWKEDNIRNNSWGNNGSFTMHEEIVPSKVDKNKEPYVTVSVNGKSIILKKMFLFTNKTGTKVDYIDFYGKDKLKGKEIVERFYITKN